eukprot:11903084-Ditylum_brightwellii.AAC.1
MQAKNQTKEKTWIESFYNSNNCLFNIKLCHQMVNVENITATKSLPFNPKKYNYRSTPSIAVTEMKKQGAKFLTQKTTSKTGTKRKQNTGKSK